MTRKLYYNVRPFFPRWLQLQIRRHYVLNRQHTVKNIWPINENAGFKPKNWAGWPDHKKFALVLTHDVEYDMGQLKCPAIIEIEKKLGFKSAFYFVPERYNVLPELRDQIKKLDFEVGVHGLKHDGKLYNSREIFLYRAKKINQYLKAWGAVGFRSPAMHHNLIWIHDLNIEYDASTFDTDPFEPQPDGVDTIFPFWVNRNSTFQGFTELPYTLPQDHTLFIIMKEKNINIWKRKLDWIVEKGGMALLNTHPDYMKFGDKRLGAEEYSVNYYKDFLLYIKEKYEGEYWHVLPKELAKTWKMRMIKNFGIENGC
jgi:peptidoglycan/xylan/chitin deacetylase (PgdA/CDA1 family)